MNSRPYWIEVKHRGTNKWEKFDRYPTKKRAEEMRAFLKAVACSMDDVRIKTPRKLR